MAYRGVYGILKDGEFRSVFSTGAHISNWIETAFTILSKEVTDEGDLSNLFDDMEFDSKFKPSNEPVKDNALYMGGRYTDIHIKTLKELNCDNLLSDLDDDTYAFSIYIEHLPEISNYTLIDASARPMDSLFIEVVLVLNLDERSIDIYSGGLFKRFPELKESKNGQDFVNKAQELGQTDNLFVKMFSPHFVECREASEYLGSQSFKDDRDNGNIDLRSEDFKYLHTRSHLFGFGPVCKIASIAFNFIDRSVDNSPKIIKQYPKNNYVDIHYLAESVELYKFSLFYKNDFNEVLESKPYANNLIAEARKLGVLI